MSTVGWYLEDLDDEIWLCEVCCCYATGWRFFDEVIIVVENAEQANLRIWIPHQALEVRGIVFQRKPAPKGIYFHLSTHIQWAKHDPYHFLLNEINTNSNFPSLLFPSKSY